VMDEVRIWGDIRTEAEINANLFNELTGSEAGLLNYYNFNEAAGTALTDQTAPPENGVLTAFSGDDSEWVPTTDKPESFEYSLRFDGANDFVDVPLLTYENDFTLEAWVRLDNNTGSHTIASWDFDTSPYAAFRITDGFAEFETFDGTTASTVVAPDSIAPFDWYHVAMVKQGVNVEIFINGFSKKTGTISDVAGSSNFRIGNYESDGELGFLDGQMDELRLWNTALDLQTIRDYASTTDFSGHPGIGNFVFYADFNEGIVAGGDNTAFNTLEDLTSSGLIATLDPGFVLNGFDGNFVQSDAFEAVNLTLYANDIELSRFSSSNISVSDNTDFGVVLLDNQLTKEFLIINNSFNTAIIDEVNPIPSGYETELSNVLVQPFDTVTLTVTFQPESIGNQSGDIDIFYSFFDINDSFNLTVGGLGYPNESGPGNALSPDFGQVALSEASPYAFSKNDPFSMEAWVKIGTTTNQIFFSNVDNTGIEFSSLNGNLAVRFVYSIVGGEEITSLATAVDLPEQEWAHVAFTYDGSGLPTGLRFYINGVFIEQGTSNFTSLNDLNTTVTAPIIASYGDVGEMDELRIWGIELSPEQIRDNYLSNYDPATSGLVSYFRFDEDEGGIEVIDLINNSIGTLSLDPTAALVVSHVPLNNESTFDGLSGKNALWSVNQNEVPSANMQIFNSGFLQDNGDNIVFAHDSPGALDDETVTSNLSLLQPLVDERLQRSWYIEISDSTTIEGGPIDILFEGVPNDSTQTYYLLSTFEGISDYFIVPYDGYNVAGDSVFFRVEVDSIPEKGFFTLGRANVFPGNALAFDGVNDSTSTTSGVSHGSDFTYEAWIKVDPSSDDLGGLISLEGDFGSFVEATILSDGKLSFTINDGSFTESINSASTIRDGNWHHFAVTRDFINGLQIYIDGVFEDTSTPDISAAFFDGNLSLGINRAGNLFSKFAIDEFRIWGRARTAEEISENYETTVAPGNPDLVLYNRFDQLTENLPDLSQNTTVASLYNFDFDFTTSGWVTSDAFIPVIVENALAFDGVGDNVMVASLNPPTGSFTLEAWINFQGTGSGFETIMEFGDDSPLFGIEDGVLTLLGGVSAPDPIELNVWRHVAVTYDDATNDIKLYENGIQIAENNAVLSYSGSSFGIGQNTGNVFYTGIMDDVRVWDRALTEADIRANILKPVDPGSADLVAFYDFNIGEPGGDNSGLTNLPDLTGNHDGFLANFSRTGTASNLVASTTPALEPGISVSIDDVEFFNNEELDYGVVFDGDEISTEIVLRNTGFDTLRLSAAVDYGVSVNLFDDLSDMKIEPFSSDTIRFGYAPSATVSGEQLLTIFSDDPTDPTFSLTASALVYNDLPGAGNSLLLDGISDVATTPNNVDGLTNKSFTVEFWAKRASNTTDDFVFGSGPVTSAVANDQLHIGFKTGDIVTMSFQGDDLDYAWTEANTDWNHFAMSYNVADGKQKIHINGIAVDSTFAGGNYVGLGQFYVGAAPFGGNFEGSIEELRVWSFALPDSVIRTHMTRKLGRDEDFFLDSLIAYYRFDEGSGTEIFDLSENFEFGSNHLDLTGGIFESSGAYVGDGNLFTYDATEIDTNPVSSVIKLSNIADPSKGVHLFAITDDFSNELTTDIYQSVRTDEIFGVFAPGGNTFDFNYGTASFGTDDSLRIVKRVDNAEAADYFTVSNLFGVDKTEDSVRAFNQTSGIFSIAKINYPSLSDAGTALNFSAASESVVLSEPALEVMGDFTVELWVNIPSASDNAQRNFFQQEDADAVTDRQLVQLATANGTLYYFIRPTNGGAQALEFGNQNIADDQWHHVAFIRSGNTLNMYIDGALDQTSDLGFTTDITFPANALASFNGKGGVDEMRIWNTSLDINVMRDYIYTNEIANHPNLSELKGYYRFDDDAPSTNVLDLAANKNGSLTLPGDWVASGAFSVPSNTVVSFADDGPGSLRDVIEQANLALGMDTVKFDLPGTGPWVITTASQINVTDSLYLDATTQPGWDIVSGAVVEINGSSSVPIGIAATSDYIEVYGMRFNNFANVGLELNNNAMFGAKIGSPAKGNIFINNGNAGLNISGADNSIVKSNFVGANFDGSEAGNDIGIFINNDANNNIIGDLVAEANVITANNVGVQVNDATSAGNLIRQNEFFCNISHGILLAVDGNNNIAAPVITSVSETEVTGTGVDGQEIDVYDANDACSSNQGNGYLGTVTVSGGVWTLTGLTLTEGNYVTATASTIVDGSSAFADRVRFADPPADPTVNTATFNTLEPIITGTYEVGTELTVEIDGTTYTLGVDAQLTDVADIDLDGITDWTLDLTGFPLSGQGVFDVVVTSTKTAISLSVTDQTIDEINIDTTLPTPPTVNNLTTNNDRPTITGTFEVGTSLEILLNAVTYVLGVDPELTDDGLGNWTLNLSTLATGLPEDIYDLLVTSTDAALNSATDNSTDELIIDLTAPVVSVTSEVTQVVSPAINGLTDDNSATINVTVDGNDYIATNNGDGSWTVAAGTITPDLTEGTYEIIVNASDLALNNSTDATNNELIIVGNPVATDANPIESFSFTANWNSQDGITNYVLDVSADNAFTQLVAGFDNAPVSGNAQTVNGLEYGTPYFYRVRSVLSPGDTTGFSNIVAVKTEILAETVADSMALVNIYNDMNGVNWTDNTNWLQPGQRIETWAGVNVDQGRVVSISLINNNLNGSFPVLETGELDALEILALADNEISGLSNLTGLTNITLLQVQNNQLTFADLVDNALITGIEYIPQDSILEAQSEFINAGQDLTLDRSTGNPGDVYSWFKNDVPIAGEVNGTLVLSNISFADEGTYRASVTNTNVLGLTLETREITVRVSSLERDSLALRELYVEMNGADWSGINDWTTLPINQWTGIGISNNRVDSLNLSGQGLVGTFSSQVLDVLNLRYVNISGNDVESIPDMTSLVNLTTLDLTDNRLHFDDLIPNVGITGVDFSNQKPVDEPLPDIYLPSGSDFELSVEVGGEGNVYEWTLGSDVVQSGSNPAYQITGIQRADMGLYQCVITNSAIPGFSLNSNVRGVFAKAMLSGTTRISESELLTDGRVLLFQVNDGAYDTIDIFTLDVTGTYTFDTLLADYLILVDPTDNETYIP
ncbi:MAG: LamG-like jellyroll fold domain-containing protein, partial [Bacteroidota bacterium]